MSNLPAVKADTQGLLRPQNIEEGYRLAQYYASSGLLADRYKNNPVMVLTAMQFCIELGLPAVSGMSKIAVIKGTPCLFGEAPLALAMSHKAFESIKESYFDEQGLEICLKNQNLGSPVFGALCVVKRKGDPEPRETYFTMAEARDAKLYPAKDDSAWMKYPKVMLKYRARAQALRDKFPDAIMGIGILEYDFDMHENDIISVTPIKNGSSFSGSGAMTLEEKLKAKEEAEAKESPVSEIIESEEVESDESN